jgi:hypothetical protein
MKRVIGIAIAVALWLVSVPVAEAITITLAEVQNGVAVVQGNKAAKQATIVWETANVGQTTKGGSFGFSSVVPADCVGTLSDGVSTIQVTVLACTPISAVPAPVPRTGQTASYAAGDDGALQKGVPLPTPRFTDNNNGTLTDNLTGLIWLKKADCSQFLPTFGQALADVTSLNTTGAMNGNNCGDASNGGSHQTDWRLPNIRELLGLVHFGFFEPALSNAAGTGKWDGSDAFTGFQGCCGLSTYWSSTANASDPTLAWVVDFDGLFMAMSCPLPGGFCPGAFVLPVRGGPGAS